MSSKTYFITGANRGIGFELVNQFLLDSSHNVVIATARDPSKATALKELSSRNKNLHIIQLDVSKEDSIETIDSQLSKITDSVDVFISNAAIADSFDKIVDTPSKVWESHYSTNVLGAILVFQKLHKYLVKGTSKDVVFITSIAGTFTQFFPLSASAYGQSKAALNYTVKELSFEHEPEGFKVVAVHPGAVSTEGGVVAVNKMAEKAPEVIKALEAMIITPQESASKLKDFVNSLGPKNNGLIYNYDGTQLGF
ncbi:uncharacterized protein RJT20DRAFT_130346 [Scheffersomyces xylosifermentans]|uniref:uncharacterized protein n=1 Tax=Scheffersomyces xylosifermentans TaxID=1304137 RepID=UPI00315D3AEC